MRQAIKEPPIAHEHLPHIYGEKGEKVTHKLVGLQLSWKDQVSIRRLWSGHHLDLNYWLHKLVDLQLPKKDQVSISRLWSGHHLDLNYWLHKLVGLQLPKKDQVSISRLWSGHHLDLNYWLHKLVGYSCQGRTKPPSADCGAAITGPEILVTHVGMPTAVVEGPSLHQ